MSGMTGGDITTLTGNAGGLIPASGSGNFNIVGSGSIVVTGAPATHTLTISGGGVTGMTEHAMVVGNAAGGITSLAVATDGQLPIGSTGNNPVLATLTAGNNIGITNAAGSITIKVNGTTNHTLQVGNATGDLTSLAVGGTGVILQGNAGADPTWTTATYPSTVTKGDVLVASANNVVSVVNDVTNAGYVLTANVGAAPSFQAPASTTYASDAETIAGTVTNKAVAPSNLKAKLGTQTLHGLPIGASDSVAIAWTAEPTDGQILIGKTGNQPVLATISSGNNITATAGAGTISIAVTGTTQHAVQVGGAAGQLASLAVGTTGKYLRAATTADPAWSTLTLPDTVTKGDVLVASADNVVGSVAGATTAGHVLMANGAGAAPSFQALPASGITSVSGTANQVTATTVGSAVTLSTPSTFIAPGTIASTTTNTAGTDFISTAGNLKLPTSTSTVGQIQINSTRFFHNYGSNDLKNLFIGYGSGNFTLTTANAVNNLCIGTSTGTGITVGSNNTLVGHLSGSTGLVAQKYCTLVGATAGGGINSYSANGLDGTTAIGYGACSSVSGNGNSSRLTAVGYNACKYVTQNSSDMTVVGYEALPVECQSNYSVYIGSRCAYKLGGTGHHGNTLIGGNNFWNVTGASVCDYNTTLGTCIGVTLSSGNISHNTFIGTASAQLLNTGAILNNTFVGAYTAGAVTSGNVQNNTFIGYYAGQSYPSGSVPQYCINIGSGCSGTATETYTTRIGQTTGANAQTKFYAGGIYGVTPAGTLNVALVDSNGQLGSVANLGVAQGGTGAATLTDHGVLLGSGTGAITPTAVGATGEVLIGNTGADASWSASPTVTTMYATTFDTNVATAGVTLAGTTLAADGSDAAINITLTPKGTGRVSTAANINAAGISFDSGTTTLANYATTTSFTPSIDFGGGTTGITYTTQTGYYSRIGNIIFFQGYILLSSKGSSTGYIHVNGLPTNASHDSYGVCQLANATYTGDSVIWKIAASSSYLALLIGSQASAATVVVSDTQIENDTKIIVSGFYFV